MKKLFILSPIFLVVLVLFVGVATNAANYTLNAPLPGSNLPPQITGTQIFATYVSGMLRFLVAFAALAATVMIIIWGIIYMGSAGSESTLKNAREGITSAILGLLLALLSVLILYTINPDLVNLQIQIATLSMPGTPGTTGAPLPSVNCSGTPCITPNVCVAGACVPPSTTGRPPGSICGQHNQCTSGSCTFKTPPGGFTCD